MVFAVETQHAAIFAWQRNAEIDASIARVEAQRAAAEFARQRNAEIDTSIATVQAQHQALVQPGAGVATNVR
jgi:hypothetical protein